MQRTISIISTKGGVGKTTAAANIAGYLSQSKHTVLMIDADPQPSLSSYTTYNKNQIQHWLTSEADGRYRLRYAISQLKKPKSKHLVY